MKSLILLSFFVFTGLSIYGQIRIIKVDPVNNNVYIKNFGSGTVDISNYRLCTLASQYTQDLTSTVTAVGSLNLGAGDTVGISGFNMNDAAADIGIYLPGSSIGDFPNASMLVDWMQWGSGGNGRESVAVAKGIWTAGEFVSGTPPYEYTGDGSQNGSSFWRDASVTGLFNVSPLIDNKIKISPNPFTDVASLEVQIDNDQGILTIHDLAGKQVKRIEGISTGSISLKSGNLSRGVYLYRLLVNGHAVSVGKLMIQ